MNKIKNKLKIVVLLILIYFLFFCTNRNSKEEVVNLLIINKNIQFAVDINPEVHSTTFLSEEERLLSTNEVIFELKNNTNKKMLFMLKNDNLIDIYNLRIKIFEDDTLIKGSNIFVHPADPQNAVDSRYNKKFDEITKKLDKKRNQLFKKGAKNNLSMFNAFINQSVVVEKNKNQIFKSQFKFPFICEMYLNDVLTPHIYHLQKNKRYSFSIEYKVDKNEVEKELTKNQLDSLKKEHIEIFSGTITSNRIPMINWKE